MRMTVTRWLVAACVVMLMQFETACAPRPVVLHPDFGVSYDAVTESQALHARPTDPGAPVTGLDGYGAATAMYGYRKRFEPKESSAQGGSIVSQGIQTK